MEGRCQSFLVLLAHRMRLASCTLLPDRATWTQPATSSPRRRQPSTARYVTATLQDLGGGWWDLGKVLMWKHRPCSKAWKTKLWADEHGEGALPPPPPSGSLTGHGLGQDWDLAALLTVLHTFQDALGRTPLFWATEYRHQHLVELLLAYGADPSVQDHVSLGSPKALALPGLESGGPAKLLEDCGGRRTE